MPRPNRHLPPLCPKPGSTDQIARQHFGATAVTLALRCYFEGAFRFRTVDRILSITADCLGWKTSGPCYTTVRLWALRLGLYRLRAARLGPRWTMICDHTATFGGLKMFVICGVDLEPLEQRVADQVTRHTYDISHRIARIVQAELEPSAPWQRFEASVQAARAYCKYRARHLSPPNLHHSPDRWMNLGGIIKWFSRMVDTTTGGDTHMPLPPLPPFYSLILRLHE